MPLLGQLALFVLQVLLSLAEVLYSLSRSCVFPVVLSLCLSNPESGVDQGETGYELSASAYWHSGGLQLDW